MLGCKKMDECRVRCYPELRMPWRVWRWSGVVGWRKYWKRLVVQRPKWTPNKQPEQITGPFSAQHTPESNQVRKSLLQRQFRCYVNDWKCGTSISEPHFPICVEGRAKQVIYFIVTLMSIQLCLSHWLEFKGNFKQVISSGPEAPHGTLGGLNMKISKDPSELEFSALVHLEDPGNLPRGSCQFAPWLVTECTSSFLSPPCLAWGLLMGTDARILSKENRWTEEEVEGWMGDGWCINQC